MLLMTDSAAVLFAMRKGRSSAPNMQPAEGKCRTAGITNRLADVVAGDELAARAILASKPLEQLTVNDLKCVCKGLRIPNYSAFRRVPA